MKSAAITACLLITLSSCSNKHDTYVLHVSEPDTPQNRAIGNWTNYHSGNIDLAGVRIQQFPDNREFEPWEGRHPAMILYVMWDGRVNQIGYKPDGSVQENFWWQITEGNGRYLWENLDYSVGSDPNFKIHSIPIQG